MDIIKNIYKYKCPFCLHQFTKEEAIKKEINGIVRYCCPNDKKDTRGISICQEMLPSNFFESETIAISLVGRTGSGKTQFIIALESALRQSGLSEIGFSGSMYFPRQHYKDYYNRLKAEHSSDQHIQATKRDSGIEKLALCFQVDNYRTKNRKKTVRMISLRSRIRPISG